MNTQQKQLATLAKLFLWLPLVAATSCDRFQEDLIEKEMQVTFNNTEYYLIPRTSVVIDLRSIIKASFIDATIRISQHPQNGELLMLDTTLVRYQPYSSFEKGKDEFLLSVLDHGNLVKSQAISIHMLQSYEEFPCSLSANEDFITTRPDSEIVIKPLENDLFCGADNAMMTTSIHKGPDHGGVLLDGDIIHYTADSAYEGWDQFVYKIIGKSNDDGAQIFSYGLINVIVSDEQLQIKAGSEPIDIKIELSWEPNNACDLDLALIAQLSGYDEPIKTIELEHSINPGPIHEVINSWLVDDGDYYIQLWWKQVGPVNDASSWRLTLKTAEGILNDPYELLTGSEKEMSVTYDWFPAPESTPGLVQILVCKKDRTLDLLGF
jgi:hypothetical protein